MTEVYRAHVLNLYDDSNAHHFQVSPSLDKVSMAYDGGALPINFPLLHANNVDVFAKMSENTQAVVDEQTRAVDAETVLQDNINLGRSELDAVDAGLRTDIDAEVARATQVDNNFSVSLANEVADRQAGDQTLTTDLAFEVNRATAAESVINANHNAEVALARSEEARIELKVDDYVTANDTKLDNHIGVHDSYVSSNDTRSQQIEDDAQALSDKQQLDHDTEVADRQAAVLNLQNQINSILSNSDPAALDSLSEIVASFQADGASYVSRLDSIEATLQELVNQH